MCYSRARKTASAEREGESCREDLKWCDCAEGKGEVKEGGERIYMSF